MLMVEVNTLKIAVKTDSLKVGYKDFQRPSGTLVAWVPTALRDALLEDKYIYYYDSDSDKEIQLLVQPCDPDGEPLHRSDNQRRDDAHEKAAAKAARDERETNRRLRTLRVRYDMPTRYLRESLKDESSALKPVAAGLERKAKANLGDQHRIQVAQMRDHLDNERNTLDLYAEFRTQAAHDQSSLSGMKFFSVDLGSKPIQGYIPPPKLAELGIQQCCFRKTADCMLDRSEGFRTCRALPRFRKAAGYDARSTDFASDFSAQKRSATDARLENRREQAAKMQSVQEKRLCEPYREGKVRSTLPAPPCIP